MYTTHLQDADDNHEAITGGIGHHGGARGPGGATGLPSDYCESTNDVETETDDDQTMTKCLVMQQVVPMVPENLVVAVDLKGPLDQ